jgi:nicotinamidase-related amidase
VTSEPARDPITDRLLTPENCALLVIDYQPSQIQTVSSIDHDLLIQNIVSVARLAKTYGLPIVLSTVNVAANGQPPTIPELREVLWDLPEIDRTPRSTPGRTSIFVGQSKRPGGRSWS